MYTNLLPSFSKRHIAYPARTNSVAYISIPQVKRKHTLDCFTTYHSQVLVLGTRARCVIWHRAEFVYQDPNNISHQGSGPQKHYYPILGYG